MALATDKTRISVYLEPDLKRKAEVLAKKQKRSLSNFIEILVQGAVDEDEQSSKRSEGDA
jgi:metal-responsive CopG/Arc/MetJ family transcriptional regulator